MVDAKTGVTRLRAEGVEASEKPLSEVRVQMPNDEPEGAPEPPVGVLEDVLADPLADVPMDGRRVWLVSEDEVQVEAYYRETRAMINGQWQPKSFWALWLTKNPVPFVPVGWIEAQGT